MNANTYTDCVQFLNREAQILDDGRREDWVDLLAEDLTYRVPIRETRETKDKEFSDSSFYYDEDKGSLEMKVTKLENEYSVTNMPPHRERRFVGNIMVTNESDDEIEVTSNLLIRISKRNNVDADIITCERNDLLRRNGDGDLLLARRDVSLDQTVFPGNIDFFF